MLETACKVYDIQVVTAVEPCQDGVQVTFQSGLSATLPACHPDHEILLREVEESLHSNLRLGILVDAAGCLVDLKYADQVSVRYAKDDEDSNRLQIAFWGFGAI